MSIQRNILPIYLVALLVLGQTGQVNGQSDPIYRFSMENMRVINSRFSELNLIPHTDSTYILISDRGGKDQYNKWLGGTPYDVYIINRSNWTDIKQPVGLNTRYSDGPASFLSDDEIIITQTNKKGQINPKSGINVYELNLSYSVFSDGNWTTTVIPEFQSKDHSYAHPSLSKDGNTMIFASNMAGGYGGRDLYVSYKSKNKWSEPENLGPKVNSIRDETFPFLHDDGNLYFASNGHNGYGGTDIFVSRKDGKRWSEPLNLGRPVNSSANEIGIYFNETMDRGFVSSNRMGGRGGDDIYAIFVDKIFEVQHASVGQTDYNSGGLTQESSKVETTSAGQAEEFNEEISQENINVAKKESRKGNENEFAGQTTTGEEVEANDVTANVTDVPVDATIPEDVLSIPKKEQSERKRGKNKQAEREPAIEIVPIIVHEAQTMDVASLEGEAAPIEPEIIIADASESVNQSEYNETIEPEPGNILADAVEVSVEIEPVKEIESTKEKSLKSDYKESGLSTYTEIESLESSMKASNLMNVYFGLNSAKIDEGGKKVLDDLAAQLQLYGAPVLELHSHADATGDHNINIKLSELRARSIMQYLNKKGVPMNRMCYLAYGESDLYVAQQSDVQLNRRVEFRLREYNHNFLDANDPARVEGFAYKQLTMLDERKYFVQMAALSDMRTFSTYKLKEYGAAICYYQGGLYKYVLGPFDSLEEATVNLTKVRTNYRDAFIFRNE